MSQRHGHLVVTTRCYLSGVLTDEGFSLESFGEHLRREDAVIWVDLHAPNLSELRTVGDQLGLNSLAVENAATDRQRAKLNHYDNHDFLSAYALRLDEVSHALITAEIAAFIMPQALVTVRKDDDFPIESFGDYLDHNAGLMVHGVSGLLYALLDFVVDGHFDAVQALDDRIDRLEDLLFDGLSHDSGVQRQSFELRKSLVRLRHVVLPMREVVNTLMRRQMHLVPPEMAPYYQDLYDHVLRATEWSDSLRDLVSTILETNLTIQGNRLNVITKQVTSWAAIIAVPTAITGFYGQNLPFPGFSETSGFISSTILIAALSLTLFLIFKRKNWL